MKMTIRKPKEEKKVVGEVDRYTNTDELQSNSVWELKNTAALNHNRYRDVVKQNIQLRNKLTIIRKTLLPMIEYEIEYRPENAMIVIEEVDFDKENLSNAVECAEVLRRIVYYQQPLVDRLGENIKEKEKEIINLRKEIEFQQEQIKELTMLMEKQEKELDAERKKPKTQGMKILVKEKLIEQIKEPVEEKIIPQTKVEVEETIDSKEVDEFYNEIEAESEKESQGFVFDQMDDNPFDYRSETDEEMMRKIAEPTYLTILRDNGVKLIESDDPKFDKKVVHQGKVAPIHYIDFIIDSIQYFDDLMKENDNICLVFSDNECYRKGSSQFTKWLIRQPKRRKDIEFSLTSLDKVKVSGLENFNHL